MIEVKVNVIPECSDGDIKHWIQFFSDIENVEKAPHQAMQNDILFYLNSLKYFKDRAEEMQKVLKQWENFATYLTKITSCSMTENEIRQAMNTFSQKGESQ